MPSAKSKLQYSPLVCDWLVWLWYFPRTQKRQISVKYFVQGTAYTVFSRFVIGSDKATT